MSVRPSRRHPLSVLAVVALLWAAALLVVSPSASMAGSVKGSLAVISVGDQGTGFVGAVAGRPFDVVVEARDPLGVPLVLPQDTKVRLSLVTGSGTLGGVLEGTIAKRTSQGTVSGATYAPLGNGITLGLATVSGTALSGTTTTINVAASAVRTQANPHSSLNVTDPGCPAPSPTSPVCGFLQLPNGGNGTVLMSVGSCDTILTCRTKSGTTARLVTAEVSLKDANGVPLYTPSAPATFILACDKTLCGQGGVSSFPIVVDLTNTGAFAQVPDCPSKGVLGTGQTACRDTVQSTRDNAGDVYSVILFTYDIRGSYP
ncbi:hypothetical protein [Pedococcus bigeumensis]|uniref:Uncharacterized protein n=1 Tax=Pedococcus bigeumensis TaxID=433644 RepID=A0A502CX77_9MICO|nr:hypothetical protein [Pedococcus bigeumensis]TPG17867.1 hypothetical protein EAH86_05385 [Pedococcus bigeumensis]